MEKVDFKKLNEIIYDYIDYLRIHNPLFLYNVEFFYELHKPNKDFSLNRVEYIPIKMNALDTFKLVKDFYEIYHKGELKTIEELFNDGIFNIYYLDELKDEQIYIDDNEHRFRQSYRNGVCSINLPLEGNINDFAPVIHEIRHQLNCPNEGRSLENDMLTEALSIFDEIIGLDFLGESIEKDEPNKIKQNYISYLVNEFGYVYFISKLVNLKERLGYINIENYNMLYAGEKFNDKAANNCDYICEKLKTFKNIKADEVSQYTFGVFLSLFMYDKYKQDNSYLDKVKKLNMALKNNENIAACLRLVDINLEDENVIDELRKNLINELKLFKENVKTM